MSLGRFVTAAMAATLAVANAQGVQRCSALQRHGKLNEAAACYTDLTRSRDAFDRAEGYLGLQRYEDANAEFRDAEKSRPNSAEVKAEWARLFSEHAQPADAAKLYEEAIQATDSYAPAYLGLARVLSENYDRRAVELCKAALQRDPKLFQAHEFLAYLALEDDNRSEAVDEANKSLALDRESLDGMAVLASMDFLSGAESSSWM